MFSINKRNHQFNCPRLPPCKVNATFLTICFIWFLWPWNLSFQMANFCETPGNRMLFTVKCGEQWWEERKINVTFLAWRFILVNFEKPVKHGNHNSFPSKTTWNRGVRSWETRNYCVLSSECPLPVCSWECYKHELVSMSPFYRWGDWGTDNMTCPNSYGKSVSDSHSGCTD